MAELFMSSCLSSLYLLNFKHHELAELSAHCHGHVAIFSTVVQQNGAVRKMPRAISGADDINWYACTNRTTMPRGHSFSLLGLLGENT
jgi:hypothetical protein